MQQEYTISAIATPVGQGGIGIVRLSGEKAVDIAQECFKPAAGGKIYIRKMEIFWMRLFVLL